jgi:hypothetical protein
VRVILGVLLLAALLLVGCGGNRSATEKAMDAKFRSIDYQMSTLETITSPYNIQHFAKMTEQYIALVREYAHELGRPEARRRLEEKAYELGSYCLPCVGTLDDEAKKY